MSDKLSNSDNLHMDQMHYKNDNICDSSAQLSNSNKLHIEPTHGRNINSCDKRDKLSKSSTFDMDLTHGTHGNRCENSGKLIKGVEKHMTEHETTNNNIHEKDLWNQYDVEFFDIVSPLQDSITKGNTKPDKAGAEFSNLLTSFLATKPNLVRYVKTFFKHKPAALNNLKDAKALKTELEKKARQKTATAEDKSLATQSLRHYEFLLKEKHKKDEADEMREQERQYKRNFHKFAKDVVNGNYGKESLEPTYSENTAFNYYKEKYSEKVEIDFNKLDWFPKVPPPSVPYNLSPYTEDDVKEALKGKNQNSSPGDDQILYGYLTKLPKTHQLLATLFTLIRDTGTAPESWGLSNIILIPKGDREKVNTENPADFRMIALTANVAKLYHTMESSRTISFMTMNKYLDPTAQKAYIEGINGCVEHVKVIQEVIQHAKANNKTAHITWFDLIDAFGSLKHMLIHHVLRHYHLPNTIINYIMNIYSKLKGLVKTKNWKTEVFEFLKGVFQGDPFSGTIFLITFNPLIDYIKKFKETQGYQIKHTKVITTPFADDFNLVSNNKGHHQKLINEVVKKAETMGLISNQANVGLFQFVEGHQKM